MTVSPNQAPSSLGETLADAMIAGSDVGGSVRGFVGEMFFPRRGLNRRAVFVSERYGEICSRIGSPSSLLPGGGAECSQNLVSKTDTTVIDAGKLCPELSANPTGPYPDECASFDQLGIRVLFLAVSHFAKSHYVSHTIGDHTSILAFVEKRFLTVSASPADDDGDNHGDDFAPFTRLHLTMRDQFAHTLEDMFDFDRSPNLNTTIPVALLPTQDCTPQ